MSLFSKPASGAAFLKMGMLGFGKSGKTHTSCLVAIGLHRAAIKKSMAYAGRPVFFIDSEGGSDYILELFEDGNVPLEVAKTRAFSDLCEGLIEAEANASVLIIDSLTHFWQEFQATFERQKNRKHGLAFGDWAELKGQWRAQFTDSFLNSNLHIIVCGRANYDYEDTQDERGKKGIEKVGVKMAAEKDFGFEPSLLVHMIRDVDKDGRIVRKAHVMGDRFRSIDGKTLPQPNFKTFVPHIEKLNWGGQQKAVNTERTSAAIIKPDDWSDENRRTDRQIAIDHVKNLLNKHFSTSRDHKAERSAMMEEVFGSSSDTFLEKRCSLEALQAGYDELRHRLEKSRDTKAPTYGDDIRPIDEIPFLQEAKH